MSWKKRHGIAKCEQDFAPGGRGAHLLEEAKADIAAGRTKPMHDFLAKAKAKREPSKTGK